MRLRLFLKQLLPPFLTDFYSWIRLTPQEQAERRAIKRIMTMPRYTAGETDLLGGGTPIRFLDNASLLFIFDEVFKKEIYKFHRGEKKPFIIDAGANIGLSVIYFKSIFPDARVIAFEPDPKVFSVLDHNVGALALQDVELVNKGLWNEQTFLNFFSEGADAGRVATAEDKKDLIKIPTTLLSPYLKEGQVDFLKIDIEGAEFEVLKESSEYLGNVQNIFIEYHSFAHQKQHLSELLGILERSGFRVIINYIGLTSKSPMLKVEEQMGMDLQLNIYGVRS
jgi:FkbM family methyltransferase